MCQIDKLITFVMEPPTVHTSAQVEVLAEEVAELRVEGGRVVALAGRNGDVTGSARACSYYSSSLVL